MVFEHNLRSAELERDVSNKVVLLHLDDGDLVESTVVDDDKDNVVVMGRVCEVDVESVDHGVGGSELAAKPDEDGVFGEGVGDEQWGRGR
ncbi:hypothetical protein VNO78_09926 [Psophocarpus tetragonolobus]|uniref:Uncharacterized protein n=1 Tax=Psophocarpus tetragonolobus TaxID=3891 RepID=A0AAN9SZW0_PSOTE